ncbi:hypothetical protein IF1G_00960 [Cordyceps javanica]|uniref:Uncharacterized protein n=1 Tax=Cordyceps javanica TaxID=43265 RepID=A0A545VH21_9HYPO|nr:hypothetical protein IF1G_00960 [Cordyceps javanica]
MARLHFLTLAMQPYSRSTDATFMASVAPIAKRVDTVAMMDMASGPRSLQSRSMRRMRALITRQPGKGQHICSKRRRHPRPDEASHLFVFVFFVFVFTSSPALVVSRHDHDPVALDGNGVCHGGHLFHAGQRAEQHQQARGVHRRRRQRRRRRQLRHPPGGGARAPLEKPQEAAARGHRQSLADNGGAHDGQPVPAVDPRADRVREGDGGEAPRQRVDGHGQQRVGEDGGEEQDGAKFEEARVPRRQRVRHVELVFETAPVQEAAAVAAAAAAAAAAAVGVVIVVVVVNHGGVWLRGVVAQRRRRRRRAAEERLRLARRMCVVGMHDQ